MRPFPSSFRNTRVLYAFASASVFLMSIGVLLTYAASQASENPQDGAPPPQYDKAIFHEPVPSDQLAFLDNLVGEPSGEVAKNKQFGKLLRALVPDCIFHYGWDMSLLKALDTVLKGSSSLVQVRDGRYVMVSGRSGPYLQGRGFMWIDMQDGIGLGGFY